MTPTETCCCAPWTTSPWVPSFIPPCCVLWDRLSPSSSYLGGSCAVFPQVCSLRVTEIFHICILSWCCFSAFSICSYLQDRPVVCCVSKTGSQISCCIFCHLCIFVVCLPVCECRSPRLPGRGGRLFSRCLRMLSGRPGVFLLKRYHSPFVCNNLEAEGEFPGHYETHAALAMCCRSNGTLLCHDVQICGCCARLRCSVEAAVTGPGLLSSYNKDRFRWSHSEELQHVAVLQWCSDVSQVCDIWCGRRVLWS